MLIECSISNCLIFVPMIFPIFIQIEYYVKEKYIKKDNILFKMFRYYLGYTLSIIFILIIKCRTKPGRYSRLTNTITYKKYSSIHSIWINPLDIEQKKLTKGRRIKSYGFLILLIITSVLSSFFNQFFQDKKIAHWKRSLGVFFEIINFIILSVLILNHKLLYRHHLFSLGAISFTLLLLIIYYIIINNDDEMIKRALWYYFIYAFLYSLYDVLGKKHMVLYFYSPYKTMLTIGLSVSIILIIYDTFAFLYFREYSGIILGFQENKSFFFYFLFPVDIILEFLWNLGIWLTIYYFTPCHFIISELISECIYYCLETIINYNKSEKDMLFYAGIILHAISYIVNIIFSLVFNEILILKCCGLNKYTKLKIQERERIDTYATRNNSKERVSNSDLPDSVEDIFIASGDFSSSLINKDDLEESDYDNDKIKE